jgi:predicted AAA+ superfamily ATPase
MNIKRHIETALLRRSKEKGAVIVTGARQVGKSTLVDMVKPDLPKVILDDTILRESARNEPARFLDLNPPPLIIDEVQYAPELFPYIKMLLDENHLKGAYYLTGSESFELMKNVTESLAGRAGILELLGLSLREMNGEDPDKPFLPTVSHLTSRKKYQRKIHPKDTWETIHRGAFPEIALNTDYDWDNFYADYIRTYIERDVRRLAQIADESDFLKFITVAAAMSGQMLNLASLARDVGISQPTAKRWLSIIKSSGLVYLLQPYSNNAITRAVKTPKLHFLDIGLASYLTRWLTPETLMNGAVSGAYFESFVVGEILKSYRNNGKEADLYFVRDSNGKEVDLLIHENNTLYPLEIKQTTSPSNRDIKHFSMLENIKDVTIGDGGVICMSSELLPLDSRNLAIPLWAI